MSKTELQEGQHADAKSLAEQIMDTQYAEIITVSRLAATTP